MDRDTIIRRGRGAETILGDAYAMQALAEVEADLFTEWSLTGNTDVAAREAIFGQIKALEMFQTRLEAYKDAAKLEQSNADRDAKDRSGLQTEA